MSNFTKAAILETFGKMLDTAPFSKITVSALIKRCGISRNTFYYHYEDIYALLDDWLRCTFGKYLTDDDYWAADVKDILNICRNIRARVYHLFDSISRDRLERYVFESSDDAVKRYVIKAAEGHSISDEQINLLSDICRYAIVGFFLRYLWNDMRGDIDESVDELSYMLGETVTHMIEQYDKQ